LGKKNERDFFFFGEMSPEVGRKVAAGGGEWRLLAAGSLWWWRLMAVNYLGLGLGRFSWAKIGQNPWTINYGLTRN